jgi:trehalose synthase
MPQTDLILWLTERSMLEQANRAARNYAGTGRMWRNPYAAARPRDAASRASVWFSAYPASVVTRSGESVLTTLGDPGLWRAFADIGIQALHTGPMKQAGGLQGRSFTPTTDGHFDRIGLDIDPVFGTAQQYSAMCRHAADYGAVVIDDIVPGHTGKGPDFRLAEMAVADYPGIYHMVAIDEADWALLPDIPEGRDSANLASDVVDILHERGYIVGRLSRVIFYEPGVKETNWSATGPIEGEDGVIRRWVYLHYFKEGQPSLNWLDPSFSGPRMVLGDALHSLDTLGAGMLRLDANGFLGVEVRPDGPAWSEGHPLSLTANQLIAGLVRKAGGFTFQELNLTVDDIALMSNGGADLTYDFITRPAYQYALVTGDTEFLRLMLHTMHEYEIDPASLIHALQNHDELTLELVHFWTLHKDDVISFQGRQLQGSELRELVRNVMYARLTGDQAPYNLRFVTNGVASTTVSVVAAALGISDIWQMSPQDKQRVLNAHLLLAMYNALQPGVFGLSGWDLVGALPLPRAAVEELMGDGDTRWINRGAYDLMGVNPDAKTSSAGLPRAQSLYGSLPEQLSQPDSFAARLRGYLTMRARSQLFAARQVAVPEVQSKGLLVMVHELPDELGTQITALNFGAEPIEERVRLEGIGPGDTTNMLDGEPYDRITSSGDLTVHLDGYDGNSLIVG